MMFRLSDTVKVLIIMNVLFFLGSLFVGDVAYRLFASLFPYNNGFQFWQPITGLFMHSPQTGWHIVMNMLVLLWFGTPLEERIGQQKFLFLYLSAGLGATFLSYFFVWLDFYPGYNAMLEIGLSPDQIREFIHNGSVQVTNTMHAAFDKIPDATITNTLHANRYSLIGASGATFGVSAAFARLYPNAPIYLFMIPFPIKAKYLVGGYFGVSVIASFAEGYLIPTSNVAHIAHVGGAVIGFLMTYFWIKKRAI